MNNSLEYNNDQDSILFSQIEEALLNNNFEEFVDLVTQDHSIFLQEAIELQENEKKFLASIAKAWMNSNSESVTLNPIRQAIDSIPEGENKNKIASIITTKFIVPIESAKKKRVQNAQSKTRDAFGKTGV